MRLRGCASCFIVVVGAALVSVGLVAAAWRSPMETVVSLPDELAYPAHATAGWALNRTGLSPLQAATQWVKAAAHARSATEIAVASRGIANARMGDADPRVDAMLCAIFLQGSPSVQKAIADALPKCTDVGLHVPPTIALRYDERPPREGMHYAMPYPRYGLVQEPVLAGYWIHNLEHGAIVLLYRCSTPCPDLIAQIRTMYAGLPSGPGSRGRPARLLALPYDDMDHQIAVVAWGKVRELDRFDREQIVAFYASYIDRGPECRDFVCPD
jgi:hypothetical protein